MYRDQLKIFDPNRWDLPIHLIGAGGINNEMGIHLAKMGVREIHVWDDDILEARNCPTEIAYSYADIGRPKVKAMASSVGEVIGKWDSSHAFSAYEGYYEASLDFNLRFYYHQKRVTAETELSGMVICGVDSMQSRKEIWETVKRQADNIPLFIDGRSAGVETLIFALRPADPSDRADYETWLYSDQAAMQAPCGARNIAYISAYMTYAFCKIITLYQQKRPIEFCTMSPHLFETKEEII